jgi:biotin operon repressor
MTAVASEVMLSLKAIAERDKVSRQAISKQVARLVEHHGLEVARDGRRPGLRRQHRPFRRPARSLRR